MQIRKIGPQPASQFTLTPNDLMRDKRLSYRARGVMGSILTHVDGWHVNAQTLADEGTEGRDAIRTAMNELIAQGFMRRARRQDEAGQWRTELHVYPYGDAPVEAAEPVVPADDEPTPENPASVSQAVIEDHLEDQSFVSDAAPPTSETPVLKVPVEGPAAAVSQVRDTRTFPIVEARKLSSWFGIVTPEQQQAWTAAWNAAEAIAVTHPIDLDVEYDPQADLAIYLSRCREERRQPMASRWLRFFIEDRQQFIETLRSDVEARRRANETPQEREDRLNKPLPPADWGVPAADGEQA